MPRHPRTPSIECRYCGCRMNIVMTSQKHEVYYHGKKRTIIKRYRKCRHCGLQFNTVETYEDEENTNLPEDITPFKAAPPPTGKHISQIPKAVEESPDDFPSPEKRSKKVTTKLGRRKPSKD